MLCCDSYDMRHMDSSGRDLAVSSNSMHASKKIVKVGGVSHQQQVLWGRG